ncbi:MAG: NAD(P)H-dependent oxidoreductase subunit E [Desulfohalobiaceae bacterium]|nr:NAD(P)H-dependent oxidoreductase subunit E [Desulfohalobiaceae bacterium]
MALQVVTQGLQGALKVADEEWRQIDAIIERNRDRPGGLIPVLEEVQEVSGYLPEPVQRRVAQGLGLPLSRVYGVVTFYSLFSMIPRGRHQIRVCLGTACHVRGGTRLIEYLRRFLKIEEGGCTSDREFGLEAVRCLGACALAPVVVVDDDVYREVNPAKLDRTMRKYRGTARREKE